MNDIHIQHVEHLVQGNLTVNQTLVRGDLHVYQQAGSAATRKPAHTSAADLPPDEKRHPILPPELATPDALKLWQRARQCKWVDEGYQPIGMSRSKAAVLAYEIGFAINLSPRWRPFERLWHRNNMRADYNRVISQRKYGEYLAEFKKGLKIKD